MRTLLLILTVAGNMPQCSQQHASSRTEQTTTSVADTPQDTLDTLGQTEPVRLVKEYVLRDSRGDRLHTDAWSLNVVVWADEPGWDEVTVISDYQILPIRADSSTARIEVRYRVLGDVTPTSRTTMGFVPREGTEALVFTVVLTGNGWRIAAPQIRPHILPSAILGKGYLTADDSIRVLEMDRLSKVH